MPGRRNSQRTAQGRAGAWPARGPGQEAGVAEAEQPRTKHEATMAEPVAVGQCPDLPR